MKGLLLRSYIPLEENETGQCIWCKQALKPTKSHIISESLITKNNPANYLRRSICNACNNYFSKIEGWLLNYSPLLVLRGDKWGKLKKAASITKIPIFLYYKMLEGWYVVHIKKYIEILPQVILKPDHSILYAYFENDFANIAKLEVIIKENKFRIDIKIDLPEDFYPRVILVEEEAIAIAKSSDSLNDLIAKFNSNEKKSNDSGITRIPTEQIKDVDSLIMYFKWSPTIWAIYNTKIAFEWFALQFGSEKALDQMFDKVRNWIFSKKINEIDDIASITGNIQNLKLGFEYQEFVLDFNDGKISIMTKKDINRGRDITQIITNENNIVKSCTIIGWLPPVNLFMSQNTFNVPVFNFIGYQFENSDVTFCRLANMNSKNFLMLFKDDDYSISRSFYKDYIIEIPEISQDH